MKCWDGLYMRYSHMSISQSCKRGWLKYECGSFSELFSKKKPHSNMSRATSDCGLMIIFMLQCWTWTKPSIDDVKFAVRDSVQAGLISILASLHSHTCSSPWLPPINFITTTHECLFYYETTSKSIPQCITVEFQSMFGQWQNISRNSCLRIHCGNVENTPYFHISRHHFEFWGNPTSRKLLCGHTRVHIIKSHCTI